MLLSVFASSKLLGLVGGSSLQAVVVLVLDSKYIHPVILHLVFSLVIVSHSALLALVILR